MKHTKSQLGPGVTWFFAFIFLVLVLVVFFVFAFFPFKGDKVEHKAKLFSYEGEDYYLKNDFFVFLNYPLSDGNKVKDILVLWGRGEDNLNNYQSEISGSLADIFYVKEQPCLGVKLNELTFNFPSSVYCDSIGQGTYRAGHRNSASNISINNLNFEFKVFTKEKI